MGKRGTRGRWGRFPGALCVGLGAGLLSTCLLISAFQVPVSAAAPTAALNGTVTSEAGRGLSDVQVSLFRPGASGWVFVDEVLSAADGRWTMAGVPDGRYRVRFVSQTGELTEWWDDVPTVADAADVVVDASVGGPVIDAQLSAGAMIQGRITVPPGVSPTGVVVSAVAAAATGRVERSVRPGPDGRYQLLGLRPGRYRISFDADAPDVLDLWWPSAAIATDGAIVDVGTAGSVNQIDGVLPRSASLSGVVRRDGKPVPNASVALVSGTEASPTVVQATRTGADGGYRLSKLMPGAYRIRVLDPLDSYPAVWWPNSARASDASRVSIADGESAAGYDIALSPASGITGEVVDDAGSPTPGTRVSAFRRVRRDWSLERVTVTGPSGSFDFAGLPRGEYRIRLDPPAPMLASWLGGESVDHASVVMLDASAADLGRVSLERGGAIAGVVTVGSNELGEYDITAGAYRRRGNDWMVVREAPVGSDGRFRIDGLPTGSYRVRFDSLSDYADRWFPSASTVVGGRDVSVVAGVDTAISTRLSVASVLAGTVTNASGAPVAGALVTAWAMVGEVLTPITRARTDAAGRYRIGQLGPGLVRLSVTDTPAGLAPEWWGDAAGPEEAAVVVLDGTSSGERPGYDVTLGAGGAIAGRLPAESPAVLVLQRDGHPIMSAVTTRTLSNGEFRIEGLAAGSYRMMFTIPGRASAWWPGSSDPESATLITVSDGTVTELATPELPPAQAVVSGSVSSPVGQPVEGVVSAYVRSSVWSAPVVVAPTDAGDYRLSGLPAGTIDLRFEVSPPFQDEWWNNASSRETALGLEVEAGRVLANRAVVVSLVSPSGVPDPYLANLQLPAVSGTARVGGTLTADAGSWSEEGLTYSYQWFDAESPIADADEPTLVVSPDLLGHAVWVRVTAARDDLGAVSAESTRSEIGPGTFEVLSMPTLQGMPEAGLSVSVRPGVTSPVAADVDFSWALDGVAIPGASESAYVPAVDDVGHRLGVSVTYRMPGYLPYVVTLNFDDVVAPGQLELLGPPVVSGTFRVGMVLASTAARWSTPEVVTEVQWLRDGVAIVGADQPRYRLTADDLSASMSLRFSGSARGYRTFVATTAEGPRVAAGELGAVAPATVVGSPAVGESLVANPPRWAEEGVRDTYQWLLDDVPIPGATDPSLLIEPVWAERTLSVTTTSRLFGYETVVSRSAPQQVQLGHLRPLSSATVSGSPKVGVPLVAEGATWREAGVVTSFQWLVDDRSVAGATGSSFTPAPGHLGGRVSVLLTASLSGYRSVERRVVIDQVVARGSFSALKPPQIVGTPQVGVPLTYSRGTWTAPNVSEDVMWFVGGVPVGVSGSVFTPRPEDAGATVTVRVAAQAQGYEGASVESVSVGPVALGELDLRQAPRILGTARVGERLTIATGTYQPRASESYTWFVDGVAVVREGTSLLLLPEYLGKRVSLQAAATATGYVTSVTRSESTAPISPGAITYTGRIAIVGKPKVGSVLRLLQPRWVPTGVRISYLWSVGGVRSSSPTFRVPRGATNEAVTLLTSVTAAGRQSLVIRLTTVRIRR